MANRKRIQTRARKDLEETEAEGSSVGEYKYMFWSSFKTYIDNEVDC